MNTNSPIIFLTFVMAMTVAAGVVLRLDRQSQSQTQAKAKEFQQLVRGLGLGPALDLSECAFSFDPRVERTCSHMYGPIPSGIYFCRQHACSILFYPPLATKDMAQKEADEHALLP